ncbi:zinc finger protein 687 [Phyllostomus discolor]|uniref:Zinc finger protein 687 n=1 Tax=Phyllostomus discolor TaxID=89673 RepID=A0A834DAY7_9CHIR|nr:zinc finger protein 687 [Phyllostomus discolor]
MGDMKTPDFDDLLAAFDIPDIDANEAIHSGPEENEGPGGSGKPEPSVGGESGEVTAAAVRDGPGVSAQASDHGLPSADISAVSVIVKNTVCPEQSESLLGSSGGEGARAGGTTKEGPVGPRLMQNGFGGPEPSLPGNPHSPTPPSGGTWKEKSMEGKAPLDLFAHFEPEPGEHPDPLPPSAPSPPREGAMTPPPFPSPFELAQENGPALLPPASPTPLGALKQGGCSPLHPQSIARLGSGSTPLLPLSAEPPAAPATSAYTCFRCLECKEQCRDKAGMAAHFQQLGPPAPGATSNVCSTCPMMLPNRCSFSAHQRMHKNRPPHVCPECGGNFLQANFQTHLREACLHFSRRVGYRCPSCAVVFGGVNSIKSHIQTSHCEVFHKCPICPMAFKSAPSAHAHLYTQHPNFLSQQAKMIYKCAMCDTVFTHKPLLSSHFDQHLLPQRVSVFKCPSCPLLFAQKRTMLDHLKNTHQSGRLGEETPGKGAGDALTTPKAEPEELTVSRGGAAPATEESSSTSEEEELPSSPEPARSNKRPPRRDLGSKGTKGGGGGTGGWTCGLCHSWFPERDEYVAHMKKEHGKSVKKFPCRLCERSFCSAPSLRRHVRVNHEGIKRVYPCRYCTEGKRTFSSRLILEKHVQVRHGLPLGDQSPGRGSIVVRGPGARGQGPGRKRRQSSDSCSEEPDSTTPPAKSPRGGPGSGGPLPYRSSGSVEQSLMVGLRVDGATLQCLDCGLCFASPGSLSRHRFISHKKKRGVGSASALGLGDGEEEVPPLSRSDAEVGDSPLPASGDPLTCKVCGKSCDSPLNLKTHFRTHGMAFIRARQGGSGDN